MSDAELQRFAEMHKQDPYMFPLAFNESNTRKQLRMKGQAQAQTPQPPVNQQALAAMQPQQLPEDQGIGALNPQMQFADGGLVAFAGGGSLGDYEYAPQIGDNGEEMLGYADGGAVGFANGGDPEDIVGTRFGAPIRSPRTVYTREQLREIANPPYGGGPGFFASAEEKREFKENPAAWFARKNAEASAVPPATANVKGAGFSEAPAGAIPGYAPVNLMDTTTSAGSVPSAKPPKAKGPGIEQLMPPEVLVAARRGESGAMPRPTKTAADFSTTKDTEDFYAEKIKAEEEKASKRFEEYKKDRPGPETFAEEKALLAEDKAETEKQQRMNEGLAWLTFASTVAQPGKSALQAIVEGVSAGAGQYAKAQGDLKKAEKERKAGLAVLARMERAEGRKDYDALESYKQQLQGNVDRMNAAAIDAIAKARNADRQTAAQIWMNEQDNATRVKMTQMQVDASRFAAGMRGSAAAAKPIMTLEDFSKLPQNMSLSNAQLVAEYNKMLAAASEPSKAAVMSGPPPENALKPKM